MLGLRGSLWGILLFDDDAKLFSGDLENLQADLICVVRNLTQLGLTVNLDKFRLMKNGKNVPASVSINGRVIQCTDHHTDLGIVISGDRKWHRQVLTVTAKANLAINRIKKCFLYRDKNLLSRLYKCYVRPHVEYSGVVWRPSQSGDLDKLESVQRRATRLAFSNRIDSPQYRCYEHRLNVMRLPTQKIRQDRADLIYMYKLMTNRIRMNHDLFFKLKNRRPGDHSMAVYKERPANNWEKGLFWFRVVDLWNDLPENVVSAETINMFKNRLDKLNNW